MYKGLIIQPFIIENNIVITRGYYIGSIIDNLSQISMQIQTRAGLNLTDLNIYLENFCKELLNHIYSINLINLNEDRSNEAGVDLGDAASKIAYQITSTKTLDKIKHTVDQSLTHKDTYSDFFVLILQPKQRSYSIKEYANAVTLNFTEKNILDFNDLSRDIVNLDLSKLEKIFNLVTKETSKILIDLEIPNIDGTYNTNLDQYIEQNPPIKFETANNLHEIICAMGGTNDPFKEINYLNSEIGKVISKLNKLPKVSRHILAFIFDNAEYTSKSDALELDFKKFKRVTFYKDVVEDFDILEKENVFTYTYNEQTGKIVSLRPFLGNNYLSISLHNFVKEKSINVYELFVNFDFTKI